MVQFLAELKRRGFQTMIQQLQNIIIGGLESLNIYRVEYTRAQVECICWETLAGCLERTLIEPRPEDLLMGGGHVRLWGLARYYEICCRSQDLEAGKLEESHVCMTVTLEINHAPLVHESDVNLQQENSVVVLRELARQGYDVLSDADAVHTVVFNVLKAE